jgi:hemolysin activation/secretion protein
MALYIVPGTLEVILIDSKRLASLIRATQDEMFRFHPKKIAELRTLELGEESLREVAKLSLNTGIQLSVTDEDIVVDSEQTDQ